MAWYPDLSPCRYFGVECERLLAVGWLESGHQFEVGPLDPAVSARLEALRKEAWQPMCFMGTHPCQFCVNDGPYGLYNLFIPGDGVVYASPELIVHYIHAHQYRPPDAFCQAVLSCPEMSSRSYLESILANGGHDLV